MNVTIYLDNSLAKQLKEYTRKNTGKTRNMIIREAIQEWIEHHQVKRWPKSVLNHAGYPEMPAFEATRCELLPSSEDPLE